MNVKEEALRNGARGWIMYCSYIQEQRSGLRYYVSAELCMLMNRKNHLAFAGLSLLLLGITLAWSFLIVCSIALQNTYVIKLIFD